MSAYKSPHEWDEEGVGRFSEAMLAKLARKRAQGRGGWQHMDNADLWRMLREHVEKGDPVDIANLAMMIWNNDLTRPERNG